MREVERDRFTNQSHFHVDVLGPGGRKLFRGLTVVRQALEGSREGWLVVDERRRPPTERDVLFGPGCLREALRHALKFMRAEVGEPCFPLWKAAPFEMLGYRGPKVLGTWLGFIPVPGKFELGDRIGVDGLPERRTD